MKDEPNAEYKRRLRTTPDYVFCANHPTVRYDKNRFLQCYRCFVEGKHGAYIKESVEK